MAGHGSRFQHSIPKQFHRLSGQPIYSHTLKVFQESKLFDEIILVCHSSFLKEVKAATSNVKVICGGSTRQASSLLGLHACQSADIVVIHDGARPFVTRKILFDTITAAKRYGAVDTCIPCRDTIVQSTDSHVIENIPNRNRFFRGQTPQSFKRELILKAHNQATIEDATDDCQLVHQMGHPCPHCARQ